MKNTRLIRLVSIATTITALVLVTLKVIGIIPAGLFREIVIAKFFGIFYFFSGIFLYKRGFSLENSLFMMVVMGGMMVRMAILLGGILFCLNFLKINEFSFILVVFIFYILYLCAEIYYLHNMQTTKKLITGK